VLIFLFLLKVPEISTPIIEEGVQPLTEGKKGKRGSWYEAFLLSIQEDVFWTELEGLLRSLTPGKNDHILI
jgi:hypothetical protein